MIIRQGNHIRLIDQQRICFMRTAAGFRDVEMIDYHQGGKMPKTKRPIMTPVHPGDVLKEDFLDPLGVSQYRLAQAIGVPSRRINEIVHGTRRISADTALRLARYFGMSDGFWMNLQGHHDIEVEKDRLGATLAEIEPLAGAG